jgi:hypothetical protein
MGACRNALSRAGSRHAHNGIIISLGFLNSRRRFTRNPRPQWRDRAGAFRYRRLQSRDQRLVGRRPVLGLEVLGLEVPFASGIHPPRRLASNGACVGDAHLGVHFDVYAQTSASNAGASSHCRKIFGRRDHQSGKITSIERMKRLPPVASYRLKCRRSSIRHEIYLRTRVLENTLNNDRRQFARLWSFEQSNGRR